LRALSLCTCCRHYPGAATGRRLRSSHPAVSAFPENVVGSACTSSFSRLARRSLALRPAPSRRHLYVTSYTEGFSHFVTSMTAPVASGWSVCRVGLAPTGKRRLVTAHTYCGRSRPRPWTPRLGGEPTYRGGAGNSRNRPETGHWALGGVVPSPPFSDDRHALATGLPSQRYIGRFHSSHTSCLKSAPTSERLAPRQWRASWPPTGVRSFVPAGRDFNRQLPPQRQSPPFLQAGDRRRPFHPARARRHGPSSARH
jgi:hypothetical protein